MSAAAGQGHYSSPKSSIGHPIVAVSVRGNIRPEARVPRRRLLLTHCAAPELRLLHFDLDHHHPYLHLERP